MPETFFPKDFCDPNLRRHLVETSLASEFIVPPFSVLNTRNGEWQGRKREWLALGIQSELGRGDRLLGTGAHSVFTGASDWAGNRGPKIKDKLLSPGGSPMPATQTVKGRTIRGDGKGVPLQSSVSGTGTSIFDPVLCELVFRWFCPSRGRVLDPFAGGSVRGIVAHVLGLNYTGIDLGECQMQANRKQARRIVPDNIPNWIHGDSLQCRKLVPGGEFDLIFTCPPYFDLEVYSHDKRDLSQMGWNQFLTIFGKIIRRSVSLLSDNRFVVLVLGDVRSKETHFYRDLPGKTIDLCKQAGLQLYNHAILVTAVGSLPLRTRKQFRVARKLGKTHQHVLVFTKGSWRRAVKHIRRSEKRK